MKKLMLAIALVSFTVFSFAAGPASNIKPAPKQETTVSAKACSQTSKKNVKKANKKAAAETKTVSVKK